MEVPSGDGFIALENGVEVRFEAGYYNTGDYWLIPARTATRDVDWPRDDHDRPQARPPDGIAHHYAPLALVEVVAGVATTAHDCREPFPSLTTITADDVAFDNDECEIPGAHTVQDALDALCESSTLRRHNKHLHGWGIVCGLRVSCGPDDEGTPRSRVTVSDGYALDCEGNDVIVDEDTPLDMFRLMKQHGLDDLLDVDRADVSLFMTSDVERGIVYGVEQFDPDWDKRRNPLAGDFLNDVYEECIQPIHAFINDQLGVDEESGVRKARVAERQSILASLMAQVVNPNASQTIYLSLREHEIVQRFYDDLKALLESETFCAMFDDAAPFPDYPDLPEMDTIFGIGHHQRIRIRPGGREAWTVGGGLNPVRPTTFVNRYDLEKRVLLERLAPFAGTSVDENEPDTGTGVITDIAFSPDGDRVYVVAPTKNGQNTLFRAGRVGDDGVKWGELVTICDTKLLTLATTGADPGHVYAVGSMTGLYKIDPGAVDPSMAPIQVFPSSGHLVMTADGRGYATAVAQGTTGSVPTYDRIIGFTFGSPTTAFIDVALPAAGSDGLAVATTVGSRSGNQIENVYVTTGTGTGSRTLLAYDARSGAQRTGVAIDLADSPLTLQPFESTGVLMVASEDDCLVELVDLAGQKLLPKPLIPVQVGPVSAGSSDKLECAYVLNYWSDTITVIPASRLGRDAEWPLQLLADYRRDIIHAFRDLLAGFLQYLKDCLCDHLMVDCPVCNGDEKIYLATINMRDHQIYKVCNFSRRKYVKSFPTVDYWLSIVPIMPIIQKAVEEFCCVALPDLFGRPTVPEYDEDAPRRAPAVRYSVARENVDTARNIDISAKIKDVQTRTTVAARTLGRAGRRTLLDTMTEPAMRTANLVDRPIEDVEARLIERGVRVLRGADEPDDLGALLGNVFGLLRTPRPGDEVTLHEDEGRVSYMSVARPSARRMTGDIPADVEELARAVEARDAEVAALRTEVERLQTSQATAPARVDDARVTALETELKQLRGLRDQVTSLLASRPATGRQATSGSAKTQPKTAGTGRTKPTTRRTTRKPRSGNG